MKIVPRPYQLEADAAISQRFERERSTMVVMATGLGKSVLLAMQAKKVIDSGKRVLVLAHRRKLIHQLADTLEKVTHSIPDVEMADRYANEGGIRKAPIVVSTVQTQNSGKHRPRMQRFDPEQFGLVIVDETHRVMSKQFRRVVNYYMDGTKCKLLGVTATPDRRDKRGLGHVFESCAYRYEIREGIQDGWLVPIRSHNIQLHGVDFSKIRKIAGELSESELSAQLELEEPLHQVADATLQLADGRRTLLFTVSVAQAKAISSIMNRLGRDKARVIHASTPDDERGELYTGFADGRFQVMSNVDICTEGYDEPGIRCLAIARPSLTRSRVVQQIGRGTRPLPGVVDGLDTAEERKAAIAASAKPHVDVFMFTDRGHHNLIGPEDVLAGDDDTPETIERAKEITEREGMEVDKALLEAKAELEEERMRALEQKMAGAVGRAKFTQHSTSLFHKVGVRNTPVRQLPSFKQIELLRKAKMPDEVIARLNKAEAGRLVGEMKRRWKNGLCSYKQAMVLKRNGIDPKEVTFEDASRMIDQIMKGRG